MLICISRIHKITSFTTASCTGNAGETVMLFLMYNSCPPSLYRELKFSIHLFSCLAHWICLDPVAHFARVVLNKIIFLKKEKPKKLRHSTKIWRQQCSVTRSNSVVEGEFMIQLQEKTDACHRDLPGLLIVYHGLCWLFACESRYIKKWTCMEHFPFSTSQWGYFSFFFQMIGYHRRSINFGLLE